MLRWARLADPSDFGLHSEECSETDERAERHSLGRSISSPLRTTTPGQR
jgi:hypothetical protein